MTEQLLPRRLWYSNLRDRVVVDQNFLRDEPRSLVVLGEAGMGKSTLLHQLRGHEGYAVATARKLINAPDPRQLVGDATTLVIDALDEVSAQREGDAVDLVLRRLAELDQPRFILSCRIADWRSATALQGFADFYDKAPLELHLDPLNREDAVQYLTPILGAEASERAIGLLEERGLAGLWRNPQTLELVGKVTGAGGLPESKGQLFESATKLLRMEHRSEKSNTPLAALPEKGVLDAAGAGFAALILTDKEALSRDVQKDDADVAAADVAQFPNASGLSAVLESRLFEARAPDRFTYAHRAIGEFLGARWLANQADTPRKQRRLLELLNNQALVPASLRGIHAWLAWHSPALADAVIESDPMGVVEYGDADTLTMSQGRALLKALHKLSDENPRFRDWTEYRAGGLVQPGLLNEVRELLKDESAEFGLRLLVLEALKGSSLISSLADELRALILDRDAIFALRSVAGDRLVELGGSTDWPTIVAELVDQAVENSVRLASELMNDIGYEVFEDALILEMVKAQFVRVERTVGVFFGLERNLPDDRLEALLEGVAALAQSMGDRYERPSNDAITDLAFTLISRRLAGPPPSAEKLWSWLQPFDSNLGVQRETRKSVASALRTNDDLRHAVQRYVLLELTDQHDVWQRSWRMLEPTVSLHPDEDDVVWLLGSIAVDDPRWRELLVLTRHGPEEGARARAAAERFVAEDAEARAWLAKLAVPQIPEWQIEREKRERERAAKREADWERHRANFGARIEAMRTGDYGSLLNPAKAYLKLFYDLGDEAQNGPSRIKEWLGQDLRDAALAGFEAFLTSVPPSPTATDIAESQANGRQWDAAYIIVAALAERDRTQRGFDDLTSERLMAGYFELSHTRIDDHAGIGDLDSKLARELRARGDWEATLRLFFEPQFAAGVQHVNGLYGFLRSDEDADLAVRLGAEWLERFPHMSEVAEMELLDRLLASTSGAEAISTLLPGRVRSGLEAGRAKIWDAVGIILDFDGTRDRLEAEGPIDPELLWSLRARLGDRSTTTSTPVLNSKQLFWAIGKFRALFPYSHRPGGVTSGDTNPWDATAYIVTLINRLGGQIDTAATDALIALRDAPNDQYTDHLRIALAEQKRKRVEAAWVAPNLQTFFSAVTDQAPTTSEQLQAVLLEELAEVQRKITGHNLDWYKDFFTPAGVPKDEESCRDTIMKMLGNLPFGIQASPEGHLADDKRCDIECMLPGVMVPIEVKGQWHKDLWTAADRQLDLLYTNDWRAERGIYVVLWFGDDSAKKPKKPPAAIEPPHSANELRMTLEQQSSTTREGRTAIVVLDLTRPA